MDEGNEVEMSSDNKYVDFKNIQKTPLSHAAAAEKKATFERDLSMLLLRGCFHTQPLRSLSLFLFFKKNQPIKK